jgi:hypothetical protein
MFTALTVMGMRNSFASNAEQQYRKDLQTAQAYVQAHARRTQALAQVSEADASHSPANSFGHSSGHSTGTMHLLSPLIPLLGRSYQVGDSWDVIAWKTTSSIAAPFARHDSVEDNPQSTVGQAGLFHYEVRDVKTGADGKIVIRVRQLTELGFVPVDPKVDELILTLNDQLQGQMLQTHKAYHFAGHSELVPVSENGVHSSVSPLELYPLDAPEPESPVETRATQLPILPDPISGIATRLGWNPQLSKTYQLNQEDFFGRSIEMLWQQGDPWPTYLKTPNGIAILLRTHTS